MTNIILRDGGPPLPDGPWTNEPDHVEFRHLDLPCIIHRNTMGAWCGYVGVHPGHPWHGKHYDDDAVNLGVHGGPTYASACQDSICHVPAPGESDDVWWFGFDCSHYGDITPGLLRHGFSFLEDGTYRDQTYVTEETKRLAEQLKAAT